jgi:Putative Flp pilus-assembly TadE/G-like
VPLGKAMRHGTSTPKSQRGQALILAMLVMTVIFAIGALVVDLGLWLSERRAAQADADFAALAGAWEMLDPTAGQAAAIAAATASLAANDDEGNASFASTPQVVGNCVTVNVEHDTPSLFSAIFGIVAEEKIGGHAKACAGATNAPLRIVPFEIDTGMADCFESDGTPKFNSLCPLDYGAGGGNPRGLLDLDAPGDYCSDSSGSGNPRDVILSGASGTCLISETGSCVPSQEGPWHDCVAVQGGNTSHVPRTVARRLEDRPCDRDNSGTEEFEETVEAVFSGVYQARDCNTTQNGAQVSPRLVSVIVIDEAPAPSDRGYPIHAFAGFFIAGCGTELSPSPTVIDPNCDQGGGGGHTVVYGIFVNLIVENSGTGQPTTSTTAHSVSLVE